MENIYSHWYVERVRGRQGGSFMLTDVFNVVFMFVSALSRPGTLV